MKKIFLFALFIAGMAGNAYAAKYANGKYGFVVNGSNSVDTLSQKIYEWEQFDWGCYCFQAAGATAINIRMGKKATDTKSTHTYFRDELKAYQSKEVCETSSQDWLNASNYLHIPDLNILKKPKHGYFSSSERMWDNIKENINKNNPILVPITHYEPIYANRGLTEVNGFNYSFGHALIIVGYINFNSQQKYVAIRDPAVKTSDIPSSNRIKYLFDYTLSLTTLDAYLQSRQMLVFNTKQNVDLKSMKIKDQAGGSCGTEKVYDCKMNCVSQSIAESWTGDGWCDNGRYSYGSVKYNLVCPAFNNDGGDCN